MKRGNNKFENVAISLIVFLQIFLMTNFCVAQSQQIYEGNFKGKPIEEEKKSQDKFLYFFLNLLSIKQIAFVEAALSDTYFEQIYSGEYKADYNKMFAQTSGLVCCEKLKNGAICQNVPRSYTECEEELFPTSCENLPSCKSVCCIDSEEGLCYPGTPQGICENAGGESDSETNCNNEFCQQGCCILGDKSEYVTENRCQFLSSQNGYEFANFQKGMNPSTCLEKQKIQKEGACITESNTCIFGTEANCYRLEGDFYENKLCSHPDFEKSQCERQTSVGCVDGKNEIYWFDSCGNRENIYSSDKETSWNNGLVLKKDESCGSGLSNINSKNCGNCDYSLGSVCSNSTKDKVQEGNFVCRSMNCIDEQGKSRINGESWCVYDGISGKGADLVGSRHWRRICQDGEVVVDPCADYRQEVCAESTKINSEGKEMSFATCRTNRWKNCISINSLNESDLNGKTKEGVCISDSDCFWKLVTVGDKDFNYCLPHYPPGFDFWNEEGDAKSICAVASQNCTYVEDCDGCVANCKCITKKHTSMMNSFCDSLGDCGGSFNYLGQEFIDKIDTITDPSILEGNLSGIYTDGGYTIKNAPRVGAGIYCWYLEWDDYFSGEIKDMKGILPKLGSALDYGYTAWENRNGSNVRGGGGGEDWLEETSVGWKIAFGSSLTILLAVMPIALIGKFFGFGDCEVEKVKVVFTCLPWTAPVSNQSCEYCNEDPLKPCSEYRCKSLGASCEILNAGTENPVCYEGDAGDVISPKISFGEIGEDFKVTQGQNGVEISLANGECIPEFSLVSFTINTDEYAKCKVKMNERSENYSEMEEYFGADSNYNKIHEGHYAMMNVDYLIGLLQNSDEENEIIEKLRNFDLYVRCQDSHGNYNFEEYTIRFCVKNGPDLTPPGIISSNPENNSYIKYGETQKYLSIYLIEPAECKYSYTSGKDFYQMENSFECSTGIDELTDYGWECHTRVDLLEEEETKLYIRCLDQPWLELPQYAHLLQEGRERNVNEEDQVFAFKKSKSNLTVSEIYPSGNIENGFEPVTISLSAKTSGGALGNGYANCKYIFKENGWSAEFLESGTSQHKQKDFNLLAGEYKMNVECEDVAGNVGEGETSFRVTLDTKYPSITHASRKGSDLEIVTDERARCSYSYDSCMFNLENGTFMENSLSTTHQANWKSGYTYHIKCEDIWGNRNNICKVISPDYF